MDISTAGVVLTSVLAFVGGIFHFLYRDRKKWELESARQTMTDFEKGNGELRAQLQDAENKISVLRSDKHGLEFQVEAKESLIKELKDMAQQIPAFAKLSEQQRAEHKEVTTILGDVAKGQTDVAKVLTDLLNEVRRQSDASDKRRSGKKANAK